jgi:uncharacterized Zn finger protein
MSFLHQHTIIPPDEAAGEKAPACPRCKQEMWLVVITKNASDEGTDDWLTYECKNCGAVVEVEKPASPA